MNQFLGLMMLAGVGLALTTPACAHDDAPNPDEIIHVSGSGRAELVPDRVTFSVGVQSVAREVAEAVQDNRTRIEKVIRSLKELGIDDSDIRTSQLSVVPQRQYDGNRQPRITGYEVTNQVTVKRDSIDGVGRLLQAALAGGANELNGVYFSVSDPAAGREAGLTAAFADARAKAETLAQAAGRKLGRAISIVEGGGVRPPQPMAMARGMVAESAAADLPVEPGTQEVRFSISVTFALQ